MIVLMMDAVRRAEEEEESNNTATAGWVLMREKSREQDMSDLSTANRNKSYRRGHIIMTKEINGCCCWRSVIRFDPEKKVRPFILIFSATVGLFIS